MDEATPPDTPATTGPAPPAEPGLPTLPGLPAAPAPPALPPALARARARAHSQATSERRPRGSVRGFVGLGLLAMSGVGSLVALASQTLPYLLAWAAPPEAFLLLSLPLYAFVFGWWLLAVMFLVGAGLSIRIPSPRLQVFWAVITVVAFTPTAVILARSGAFPWPFAPAFL